MMLVGTVRNHHDRDRTSSSSAIQMAPAMDAAAGSMPASNDASDISFDFSVSPVGAMRRPRAATRAGLVTRVLWSVAHARQRLGNLDVAGLAGVIAVVGQQWCVVIVAGLALERPVKINVPDF